MPDTEQPSTVQGVFHRPFTEQVAYFRNKLGNRVATERWDDITREGHDTAFMVAGAAKADLLSDLGIAVDRSIAEGTGLEQFRKDFRGIVEKNGWHNWTGEATKAGRAWRTRVIYRTNASVSYAAGREVQLVEGGFSLRIYRHGGSLEPRLQHLRWDRTILPADHPFWRTNAPPNGWGCSCYQLGARTEAGAKRLGGKPGKKLPKNWNARDPKNGLLPGVGKGWDYAPGASIVHLILEMAKKTVQWEYELAKSYMVSLPAANRDALSTSLRSLPSLRDDARRYAKAAIDGQPTEPYRTMGLLTTKQTKRINGLRKGVKVDGYDFTIDRSAVRHVAKRHGDAISEARRGQLAITDRDYGQLPALLNNPDDIRFDGDEIIIEKTFGTRRYVAIFAVLRKRRMLALKSLRIISRAAPRSTP